jgi:TusA-related sulfurtransferase
VSGAAKGTAGERPEREEMVLRGVRCPLNWARAKVRLEEMSIGSRLRLVVDDPRAMRDIPRAAEAHGYAVLEVVALGDGWRIEIER